MKNLIVFTALVLLSLGAGAQVRNSLSVGGGVTYPAFAKGYDPSWFAALHWNIGLGRRSSVDTHIGLATVGVKDYADAPGVENDNHIYQLGIGYRQYVTRRFFVRAGIAAAIVNDGEASAKIFPNIGLGFDVFTTERQGIELSLKNDFLKNFDYQRHVSVVSIGVAYKFWYPAR